MLSCLSGVRVPGGIHLALKSAGSFGDHASPVALLGTWIAVVMGILSAMSRENQVLFYVAD